MLSPPPAQPTVSEPQDEMRQLSAGSGAIAPLAPSQQPNGVKRNVSTCQQVIHRQELLRSLRGKRQASMGARAAEIFHENQQ